MLETVFNLLGYYDEFEIISFLGVATHDLDGTDDEKLDFLSSCAREDSLTAMRFLLSERYKLAKADGTILPGNSLTLLAFRKLIRANRADEVFEEAMKVLGVAMRPLVCVTPIFEPTDFSLQRFQAHMHSSQFRGA